MSAFQALKAVRDAGIRIGIEGDAITLDAKAAPPRPVLDLLTLHKAGVVALLRTGNDGLSGEDWRALFDEGAAIAEFDGRCRSRPGPQPANRGPVKSRNDPMQAKCRPNYKCT
jgi:hypothetical protein